MNNIGLAHIVEFVIILGVIVLQIGVFFNLKRKIKVLKDLNLHDISVIKIIFPLELIRKFNYPEIEKILANDAVGGCLEYNEDEEYSEADLLYSNNPIADNKKIIRELNVYMLKNDDQTVNFNVIQDIVERNYNVIDEEINQGLPTPLYLGLAATMLGIIFGLWGMDTSTVGELSSISSLINGVAIAMGSSFVGVVLTTYLTTYSYRKAKKEAEEEKNEFFSKLQAELLPELLRKGETGIDALNRRLDSFTKSAERSVSQFEKIAITTSETAKTQAEVMRRIDELDVNKITITSLDIFKRLESNLESFDKFAVYWERLTKSLGVTRELSDNLFALVEKLSNVDGVANGIEKTINDYEKTMRFFTEHIDAVNKLGGHSREAVAQADFAFKDAIAELTKNATIQIQEFKNIGADLDGHLKDIGAGVANSLEIATKEHVAKLTRVYSDKIPVFEKLEQLDTLPQIQATMLKSSAEMFRSKQETNDKLLQKMDSLEKAILLLAKNQMELQRQRKTKDNSKRNLNGNGLLKENKSQSFISRITSVFKKAQHSADRSEKANVKINDTIDDKKQSLEKVS